MGKSSREHRFTRVSEWFVLGSSRGERIGNWKLNENKIGDPMDGKQRRTHQKTMKTCTPLRDHAWEDTRELKESNESTEVNDSEE